MMQRGIGAALLCLALTGCGGRDERAADSVSTPSPSPVADARYGTVVELKDAAVLAGYECKNWRQTDVVKLAAQSGSCSNADVFATFASEGDLQAQLDTFREIDAMFNDEPTPRLVGPNWVINAPEAATLQNALGGTVETG